MSKAVGLLSLALLAVCSFGPPARAGTPALCHQGPAPLGNAHPVRLFGVAPANHYVRIYTQGPSDSGLVYRGAPAMNPDWSWSWDDTLIGEGEWKVNVDAKSSTGEWLYHLDQFVLHTTAAADIITLTYQQGANAYGGTTDCYISDWQDGDETKAYGSLEQGLLRLRKVDRKLALLRFELDGLPAGAQIEHAFVAFYAYLNTNPSGPTLYAYQLLRPWAEGAATWLSPQPGDTWGEPGALGADTDHKVDYLDKLCRPVDDPTNDTCGEIIPGWHQLDITAAVQAWADGEPNHGVLVRSWDPYWASSAESSFFSSEYHVPERRPRLVIYYTQREPAPTPTATRTPSLTLEPTPSSTPTQAPHWLYLPLSLRGD